MSSWVFSGWPQLSLPGVFPEKPKSAHAATFSMQTGYYIGTGATLAITNIGFQPQLVIIKAETTAGAGAVFKTSNMAANTTAYFPATSNDTATFITLDATGFTLSSATNVNAVNVRFMWMAFAGSDCTSSGTFCVGSYTGDGGTTKAISSVGFTPDLVVVKGSSTTAAVWRSSSMPANDGQFFTATAENTTSGLFTTLDSTGFTVGNASQVNTNTTVYQYFAFKEVASFMDVGTYSGNATDSTNITGVGFVPNAVFIKNANAATPTGAVFNVTDSYGDYTETFIDAASAVDYIQSLRTDGFQVGTDSRTNGNTNTLYYAAFAGEAAYSASGTFKMSVGSYSGSGVAQSVTGLGFAPDLVIVKHADQATDQYAVFRTKLMGGDSTAYINNTSGNFTGGITSMDSDGFSVGTDATVNTDADTYYWEAFGNAFNPHTVSGAADFAIGAYMGNKSESNVLPLSTRKFTILWSDDPKIDNALLTSPPAEVTGFWNQVGSQWHHFAIGLYAAKVSMVYAVGGNAVNATARFFVFPWQLLIVVLFVMIIVGWGGKKGISRYNKWIIAQARAASR